MSDENNEKPCRNTLRKQPSLGDPKQEAEDRKKLTDMQNKILNLRKKFAEDSRKKTSFLQQLTKRFPSISFKKIDRNTLINLKNWIVQNCDPRTFKMADKPGAPSRPMKYPYTFSAKIAQFPFTHYIKNQWIWRYYFISVAVCIPVFYSISKLANSPGNVAKWAEIRRKEAAEHH